MQTNRDPLYWAAWLILLTAAVFFSRSYMPIHETRYLSVAWEMWQRGDFLVPFMNGAPYSHKPPLLFWLMQAGWAVTGVNDWWPRLLSPLLAFACLFLVRHLAAELWPERPEPARLAPWILLGSLLWSLYSQAIMFDLLVAFFALLGIVALVRSSLGKPNAWWLFALSIGLGVLAKGPVILLHLLPVALLAPWWSPNKALRWRSWYVHLLMATLGGVAIALTWAIPAGMMGGEEYRKAIFWGQTANRMVQSFAHQRPFWWYVPLLPLLLFPWFVWPALWRGMKHSMGDRDKGLRLAVAWILPAFIAFSLVSGKQVHYLLPEFPAFALMASRWLAHQRDAIRPWAPALILAVAGVLMLALPHLHLPASATELRQIPGWGGGVFLLLAVGAVLSKNTPMVLVPRLSAVTLLTMSAIHLVLFFPLSPAYDVRPMASAIAQMQKQSRQVVHVGKYHAQYQFAGRLVHPLTELAGHQAVAPWLKAHPDTAVIIYFPKNVDLTPFEPLFVQSYRGRQAALFDAPNALAALERSESTKEPPSED